MSFYLLLFAEFFKTGLFAVGGGLATLPFLYDIAERYPWFSADRLPDILAVAQSVPGAIGVNMATFAGFDAGGIPGAVTAAVALVCPSVVIIIIIARFLSKYKENFYVDSVFYGLRPAACALISSAAWEVLRVTLINIDRYQLSRNLSALFEWKSLILFAVLFILMSRFKVHPVFYIAGAAIVGIVFRF